MQSDTMTSPASTPADICPVCLHAFSSKEPRQHCGAATGAAVASAPSAVAAAAAAAADSEEDDRDMRPRVLSACGHNFCIGCLTQAFHWSRNCPKCRTPFREGEASDTPINFDFTSSIAELQKKETIIAAAERELAENAFQIAELKKLTPNPCVDCPKPEPAEMYCHTCQSDFCDEHFNRIHSSKVMVAHQRMPISAKPKFLADEKQRLARQAAKAEAEAAAAQVQLELMMCADHETKKNYFCGQCSVTCCSVCKDVGDHHAHTNITCVKQAAAAVRLEHERTKQQAEAIQKQNDQEKQVFEERVKSQPHTRAHIRKHACSMPC